MFYKLANIQLNSNNFHLYCCTGSCISPARYRQLLELVTLFIIVSAGRVFNTHLCHAASD
jgi:hypothetical protein